MAESEAASLHKNYRVAFPCLETAIAADPIVIGRGAVFDTGCADRLPEDERTKTGEAEAHGS